MHMHTDGVWKEAIKRKAVQRKALLRKALKLFWRKTYTLFSDHGEKALH